MSEQRKSIEKEQEDLIVARERMLEAYFDNIRKKYRKGPTRVRNSISGKLEKIAYGPRREEFDWERAKQIRTSAGLSQLELSELLEINQGQLSRYESGDRQTPRNIAYITWLKENGYDLNGISEED